MKKSVEILFTNKDEENLSRGIRSLFPQAVFIDDVYWSTKGTGVRKARGSGLHYCNSLTVCVDNIMGSMLVAMIVCFFCSDLVAAADG